MMENLKDKIKEEKYQEAIEIVRKEIIFEVSKLICEEYKDFNVSKIG